MRMADERKNANCERETSVRKYSPAMQVFKPYRGAIKDPTVIPTQQVGLFSFLTLHFLSGFIWNVYKTRQVDVDNIWKLPVEDTAEVNTERLQRLWSHEINKKSLEKASLIRVVLKFLRTRLLIGLIPIIIFITAAFIGPSFIMKAMYDYTDTEESNMIYGLGLVFALLTSELIRLVCFCTLCVINHSTAARLRGAVAAIMFKKLMAVRSVGSKTIGELVNIVANDSQRLFDAVSVTPIVVGGPFIGVAGTVYCVYILGWWALAGSALICLFYPYQIVMSKFQTRFRTQCIKITDKRVRIMNEMLTSMKLIKMYAWENSFLETISGIRADEKKILQKSAFIQTMSTSFNPAVPVFASVITFLGHILSGNTLTPSQAFVVIGLNILMKNRVLNAMSFAVRACGESINSLNRLQDILKMKERCAISNAVGDTDNAIEISDGTFAWDQVDRTTEPDNNETNKKKSNNAANSSIYAEKAKSKSMSNGMKEKENLILSNGDTNEVTVLTNISMYVKKGSVVGICGSIGSGKSSLISSILGETIMKSGKIGVSGKIAFVAQQPWIQNTTVRENILFGQLYEEDRYNKTIEICCLKPDLTILPAGDLTEIGERGVNLSGGQKQRISLARALYSDCEIYLLDDPFAAVDTHVGQEIYNKVIQKELKGRTVLLVTHQLQYLNQCDTVVMMKNGRFYETGSHEELMKKDNEYASLIKTFHAEDALGDSHGELKRSESNIITKNQRNLTVLKKGISTTALSLKTGQNYYKSQDSVNDNFTLRLLSEPDLIVADTAYPDEDLRIQQIQGTRKGVSQSTPNLKYIGFENDDGTTSQGKIGAGKLTEAEEVNVGVVGLQTYGAYSSAAGGLGWTLFLVFMFLVPVTLSALCNWWLSHWLAVGSGSQNLTVIGPNKTAVESDLGSNPDLDYYVGVYVTFAVLIVVALILRGIFHLKATLRAASSLHDRVLSVILKSPMSFFDTTPTGRIINRFSKDLDEADVRIPVRIELTLSFMFQILVALTIIIIVFPWFLIPMVPIVIMFLFLYQLFRTVVREIKRADNVSRSPMLSFLTASIQGINTITAFGRQDQFFKKFCHLFDRNTVPYLLFYFSVRWFALRIEILSNLVLCLTAFLVVSMKDTIPTTLGGLALVYASHVTGVLQFCVRMASEAEAGFTSIERLYHYIKSVKIEKTENEVQLPTKSWPEHGSIRFTDVQMRYRPNLPLVLQGLTCHIKPKEKIGIIGRTGAGKSSLGIALFRMAELSSGTIEIDDQDISRIDLNSLRSRLSVIPQDPVLFVGTMRYNLDPFRRHSDKELWEALDKCHVKDVVLSTEGQLEAPVIENGANFSVGERQLICMARALLRSCKILLLDEATSAIDTETDALVQQTIREAFKECTLLTIAHRLNTIKGYDRIMVLEQGKIVEFDTPDNLMKDAESHFNSFLSARRV